MKYYVYKVINKLNGKWYIGKRKHKKPHKDSYMGSGKLIKEAINKYGLENFDKTILCIFNSNDEAAAFEKKLVTKENISTSMSYNMHEGGYGGFAHLNDGGENHIERCRRGAKNTSGRTHKNWGMYRFKKDASRTKELSEKGNAHRKIYGLSTDHKNKIREAAILREKHRKLSGYYQRNDG